MIECVANASEGRDASAIDSMAAAVRAEGVRLLDVHSDRDHHRSVFTFVGSAAQVERAAMRLACEAISRIDLRRHQGVHPRVGALDVVPLVPLDGSTMADCVGLARRVGEAVAQETGVPVFLYGRAATSPARASLAALRQGGLEGLAARIGREGWVPDYGPPRLHPTAGAVAIGARPALVAYNVCLSTCDLELGGRIARAMREANCGLPGVQALAFPLGSSACVQVSMNLTDAASTTVRDAFRRVSELARGAGVAVLSSEIVGLAPRRALAGATAAELLLPGCIEDYELEARLGAT